MRRGGFSVIELIVIMGIIALLSSLLFPAIVATKSKAGETVCMSNLRQIGSAMLMYKDDEGEFPWRMEESLDGFLGHTKLRCPQKLGESAYSFGAYENIAVFALPAKDPFSKSYIDSIRACFELRGPQYPLLADKNHLPRIMRPDNEIGGSALVYRSSGAVERVPKSKVAEIGLASAGLPHSLVLPCSPNAQDANL